MKRVSEEEAQSEFERYAQNTTEGDIPKVLGNEGSIMDKVRGPLAKLADDIRLLFSMVKDYFSGAYREIPWTSIAWVIGALVYVFSPIDLIPDAIPFIGLVDDAMVVVLCLKAIHDDLQKYRKWKENAPALIAPPSGAPPGSPEFIEAPQINDEEERKAHEEKMARLDEDHAKQMEVLRQALEQRTKTMLAAVSTGTLGEAKYNPDKLEVEDVQALHKELEQIKDRFRSRGQQIEETMRGAAQVGFDIMLDEVKRFTSDSGIYIDLNRLGQQFDRVLGQIHGAVTDVISRRVSLGDAECTEILGRASRDDREEGLADFLKRTAAESIRNVQERVDDALWDAQVTVASIISNSLEDKKGQIQRSAEEYAAMKNLLSASEIAEQNSRYKKEVTELDAFVTLIEAM